jgi:hypothetical protein
VVLRRIPIRPRFEAAMFSSEYNSSSEIGLVRRPLSGRSAGKGAVCNQQESAAVTAYNYRIQ